MRTKKSDEHLCNECQKYISEFPECMPDDVQFGNGFGNDNIIECSNFEKED